MINHFLFCVFLFLCFSCEFYSQEKSYREAFDSLDKNIIKDYIYKLGDDSLQGRAPGTAGADKAAEFIIKKFEEFNLHPAAGGGRFIQNVPMHESIPLPSSELKIYSRGYVIELELYNDFLLLSTGEQTLIPAPVEMVFAGYGIIAPEFDYNDYQSIDVEGKIVLILEGEPPSDDNNYFAGSAATLYSYHKAKQRIAISRGAYGTIIIPQKQSNLSWENYFNTNLSGDVRLAYNPTDNFSIIINPAKADEILNISRYNLQDIYSLHDKNGMKSFELDTKLSFKGVYRERDFKSSNIIGMVKGTADENILVTAHYDHLGIGSPVNGDSIYNGVFDNAAGVAALLELSSAFKSLEGKLEKSIIFIALTGEEKGLLGSTYYTDNPVVPLYKTAANINIDGISLFDRIKSIIPLGAEYSTLENYISKSAEKFELFFDQIPPDFGDIEAFFRSDQIAFAMAGIPSVLIIEGVHYENIPYEKGLEMLKNFSKNIYHSPLDDLSQNMNFDAALQHVQLLFDIIYEIAVSNESPEWKQDSPFLHYRLQTRAEKR